MVVVVVSVLLGCGSPAEASDSRVPGQPDAWILFDAGTGAVLDAHNERQPLPPASVTKLLTALTVVEHVPQDAGVVISERAAGMPPMKLGMLVGQRWDRDTLLNAMLLASCNDAAVALAEASGGSLEGFAAQRAEVARSLGLGDSPVLSDPSGLDDLASHEGGDLISARDMALVARAFLADPELAVIVQRTRFDFQDPGDGRDRWVINHNRMLKSLPGASGLKTGYTENAGHTFAGSAQRDGRSLVAVVFGAPGPYPKATELLEAGFANQLNPTGDVIPLGSTRIELQAVTTSGDDSVTNPVLFVGGAAVLGALVFARRRRNGLRVAGSR